MTGSRASPNAGARPRARFRAASSRCLALGRGLMSRPQVLLLDEPSLGLAPMMVDLIFEVIDALAGAGITILLCEQNVGLTLELARTGLRIGKTA